MNEKQKLTIQNRYENKDYRDTAGHPVSRCNRVGSVLP